MPIQQMFLGVGAKKKVYMDDVFSTYLYTGDASTQTINNGINLSGEGGLVWAKKRDKASHHTLIDTVRGNTKRLESSTNDAEVTGNNVLNSFNANGFTVGYEAPFNESAEPFSTWTFRKAKGFFDVVTFNETGAPHSDFTVSHSLGCIPGMIMLKRTDGSSDWWVWHKYDPTQLLRLNTTAAYLDMTNDWCIPTSTNFTFRPTYVGAMGAASWVAYLFAGGESTAATARSVDYDGSDDNTVLQGLSGDNADDLTFGTGDFTVEGWVNPDTMVGTTPTICDFRDQSADSSTTSGFWLGGTNDGKLRMYSGGAFLDNPSEKRLFSGQWSHFAAVRSSGTIKIFINGIQYGSDVSNSTDFNNSNNRKMRIGANYTGGDLWNGKISNFRITKGQALYTTAFKPSTEPLTTTSQGATASNVKLLCCNNSSTTGSTVTPVTPENNGSPTASTDSPFDDPAGFTFGDAGDQNVIKCGSYKGNGSDTGPEINLGWEPQWVMVKRTDSTDNWPMYDVMRGITTGGTDNQLRADQNAVEHTTGTTIAVTSTGFKLETLGSEVNASNGEYIYIAIRRPDGYVGKPAEAGTDVFAMDTGAGSSTIPNFDSGFPVDFATGRTLDAAHWDTSARLIQGKYVNFDRTNAEDTVTTFDFDSNVGWNNLSGWNSAAQSWMWKRHAGFDCICYDGQTELIKDERHSLNAVPEMIWVKARTGQYAGNSNWFVYHKGLNGGTNPHTYNLVLNTTDAESSGGTQYWQRPPTSTHFSHGNTGGTGYTGWTYIAMLFASVDGISKVGSYTGNGSNSGPSITTGFSPRFIIVKAASIADKPWLVFDTLRGIASGADARLKLNSSDAQNTSIDWLDTTSTGFDVTFNSSNINSSGETYIYYAHA